jgi:PAS domain S-box-containing protein
MNNNNWERERVDKLRKHLDRTGVSLDAMLHPPYEAVILHSNSTIVTGNQAAARMIGCGVGDLTGLNAWTLFPPASAPVLKEMLAQRATDPYRVVARRIGGEHFHVEIKGREFELEGEPLRAVLLREIPRDPADGD